MCVSCDLPAGHKTCGFLGHVVAQFKYLGMRARTHARHALHKQLLYCNVKAAHTCKGKNFCGTQCGFAGDLSMKIITLICE